jgi:anhydro-N-acetylmuramic acid kinase
MYNPPQWINLKCAIYLQSEHSIRIFVKSLPVSHFMKKPLRILGLMSGTSMDGLDICLAEFQEEEGRWSYQIVAAETVNYPYQWLVKLKSAENCNGEELYRLHVDYGNYLGKEAKGFMERHSLEAADFISSHGHTIFHRPEMGYTLQLGAGPSLAAAAGMPVVNDFRTTDVALGGQGAPLVPMGDKLLFGEYGICLNLGGFANLSFDKDEQRVAGDICPVNYVLNRLAQRAGKKYDDGGKMGASGQIIPELLDHLNAMPFYKKVMPKSMGREWVESTIFPMLKSAYSTADLLHTWTVHAATQIAAICPEEGKMLVTGGGAHNAFLIYLLKEKCKAQVIVPEKNIVDFKEALVFAFLGWLRWHGRVNVLASVTGARRDSVSGAIYF